MGKKGKRKKAKGGASSGADKEARLLHSLANKGVVEKDVDEILRELEAAQIAKEEALMAITVTRVDKPKLRQNVSVVAHPSKVWDTKVHELRKSARVPLFCQNLSSPLLLCCILVVLVVHAHFSCRKN